MSRKYSVYAATILVSAVAVACSYPTDESRPLAGRYALVSVGGRALPAIVDSSAYEFGLVLADTIVLDGAGAAVRTFVLRRIQGSPAVASVFHPRFELAYRLGPGASIELGSLDPCPINALCIGNDSGTIRGGQLNLRSHRYGDGLRLFFVRIPD